MQVTVKVPGSCGELIQGYMNGLDFLVTCPIDCYSIVTIEKKAGEGEILHSLASKEKMIAAIRKTLDFLGVPLESSGYCYQVDLQSHLPVGKGMASSTADMTAAIVAIGLLHGRDLTPEEIAEILLSIEPSDGIFHNGVVAFDHLQGKFYEWIGEAFPVRFLVYDFGGQVDTIAFNANPHLQIQNLEKEPVISRAYELLKDSFQKKDIVTLGKSVTLSAVENQKILHKPGLTEIIELVIREGAYGINVAHSGTLIGILHDEKTDIGRIRQLLEKQFPDLDCLGIFHMVNGGYSSQIISKAGGPSIPVESSVSKESF